MHLDNQDTFRSKNFYFVNLEMNITIILPCNLNDKIVYSNNIILFILSDLSDCQLMQVPDAVYYMMRNTTLVSCNLSSNVITKIPPKFPAKFSLITGKKNTLI